jgi:allantoicase
VVVDTSHFKGNSPGWVSVHLSDDGVDWSPAVEMVSVEPHTRNHLALDPARPARYLRLSIHPDGGLARLRALGTPDPQVAGGLRIDYINSLFPAEAEKFLRTACGSTTWVREMVAARPFTDLGGLFASAEKVFDRLDGDDWLEAFAGHPRIGERGDSTADAEQAGAVGASRETLRQLKTVNTRYEDKFGFTYIVYATGKGADEMLAIAQSRLGNDRDAEIANAGAEQMRITETRLRKMTCQEPR